MDIDRHRIPSILSRLTWLVAACLLPGILIAVLLLSYNYEQGRANVLRDSMATARALLSVVDREFATAEISLRTLATSTLLKNNNMAAFHAQALDVLNRNSINNIVLIDATAQQVLNTAIPYGAKLPKSSNTRQLERVFSTGKSDISNLFIGPVLKRPLMNVAVPVYKDTIVTHSLVGVLLPDRLQKILDDQRFPTDRIAVIFDGANAVVGRTHDVEKFRGQSVVRPLTNALTTSDEGWLETTTLENVDVLTVYTRSAGSRWGVAIGVTREALTADLRRSLWWLGWASAVLLVGSLILAWFMAGRISRAIQQLIEPAQDLARGKSVVMPALGIREADEVGQALMQTSVVLAFRNSELQATNSELHHSEARLRGIVDSAMDAIITVDDAQNISLFNAAAAEMFNCLAEQAIGRSLHSFVTGGLLALSPGGVSLGKGLRSDGAPFPIEFSYSKVIESGAAIHTLIIRDVTARVQAHDALVRSNLDLQQFAFVASHDLKTPLRSISGFVEMLGQNYASKLDETALTLIRRTAAAVKRLEQLIDDLLSYARLSSEAKPFEPVSCRAVVDDAIELLDSAIREAGATIEVGELPTIMGDRTQLIQLFLNLIGNGIKYCDADKPVVRVAATRREHDWLFTVADNGIGIGEKHLESIFQVFKRLHTHQQYAGTGIGLAVCRRVVEHHGGKLWASSVPGKGSTFTFTIPESR